MYQTILKKIETFVEKYLSEYQEHQLIIFDIGSHEVEKNSTYKNFFNKPNWKYLGLDIVKGVNVDTLVNDPYKWNEIKDCSADVVISAQTFEHIEYPWLTIREIYRILKDRGIACIIVPSSGPEHSYPVDCWRILPDGMKALAKWTGFRVVEVFTDWGLDPWKDTFAVFQKPLTGSEKVAPFEEFTNKGVALKVYLNAFKHKPLNPEYYARAVNILKAKGEIKKAQVYMATALSMFPQNLWIRQRAVELYLESEPKLAFEHVIYLLRARPVTPENIRLIGKFTEIINEEDRALIFDQLPTDIPTLRQFAHLSEKEKVYQMAEVCWNRISQTQPDDLQAKLMHALMPRGYGNISLSKQRFYEILTYQMVNRILNRTTIIQQLINKFNYRIYFEIGVERGLNFFQIQAPLKLGVDPNFIIPGELKGSENEKFYTITSDEFFANPPEEIIKHGIDIAFIDGLHTYEQSLRDVENCLKYLNPNGIIVMHDCLPANEAEALPSSEDAKKHSEFKGLWTGDVYKTIIHLRTSRQELFVAVIDTDHGVGIIRKGNPESMLDLKLEEIKNLTFKDLMKDREKLLNLKTREWFWRLLENNL